MSPNYLKLQRKGIKHWLVAATPYCESTAIILLLMLIHRPFSGLIEERSWFYLLQIGTCYSVWRGGMMPGLFSLTASALAAAYFYLPPDLSFAITSQADIVSLIIYVILGLVIVAFGTTHHAERQRVLARNKDLLMANKKLLDANFRLDQTLQSRTSDLLEIRTWAANLPE